MARMYRILRYCNLQFADKGRFDIWLTQGHRWLNWQKKTNTAASLINQVMQSFIGQTIHREYFMESAGVRYLRASGWRIRNRTSERSERVRFLIQKQRVRKYRTKHFPCGIVFILYILRHSSFWRPFYSKYFKNAKICCYTLTAKWQRKRSTSFLVKTFVKNIKDGKDTR